MQNEVAIYCGDYSANRFQPDYGAFEQVLEEAASSGTRYERMSPLVRGNQTGLV